MPLPPLEQAIPDSPTSLVVVKQEVPIGV
jgi:hypothetical protein